MLMPCEAIIKSFLPAIRAATAKKLSGEHELSQSAIAKSLGITQAAVSNYLSGKYASHIKTIEATSEIQKTALRVAKMIAVEKTHPKNVVDSICIACDGLVENTCRTNKHELLVRGIK